MRPEGDMSDSETRPNSDLAEDVATALTGVEVVLRSFIRQRLESELGPDWLERSGINEKRPAEWARRRTQDQQRRDGVRVPESLLDYSDIPDLVALVEANWPLFEPCFHDRDETLTLMRKLAELRNPEKHARGLLDYERAFIKGIAGQLRNQIVIFRSEQGPDREYFPVIEFVRDGFGNIVGSSGAPVNTGLTLRPGDEVRFECRGRDPQDAPLKWTYNISTGMMAPEIEIEGGQFTWLVSEEHIAERRLVTVFLEADRSYHRHGLYDDSVTLIYRVLPAE